MYTKAKDGRRKQDRLMGEDREVISIASKKKRDCIIFKKKPHGTNRNMISKKLFCDAQFSEDSVYSG